MFAGRITFGDLPGGRRGRCGGHVCHGFFLELNVLGMHRIKLSKASGNQFILCSIDGDGRHAIGPPTVPVRLAPLPIQSISGSA